VTDKLLNHRHKLITDENSRWWTLGAMCFALFMIMLDNTVVNVALPSIQRDLHASLSALEWTVNAYTLTFAVILVTGGRLGDIFGRRRGFLFGVLVFGVSSAAIGFAPSDTALVAFRAVQGIGAAFMMPATLSIITQAFPPHQRGTAIGTWAGVSALALAIGPVLGGFLVQQVSWRAIFFINPPIAVIAVAVTLFAARESRDETVSRQVDYTGIASITIGLTALVLALVEGNSWHWGSARIVSLLAVAAVGIVTFVIAELRGPAPMVDFGFFRSKTFLGANLVAFIVSFAMLAQFFFLALYMQNILHYSPLQTGVRFLPSTLIIIVAGPLAGRLTDKVGSRLPMVLGLAIVALALFIQSHLTIHTGYGLLLPGFVLMGLGMGLTMSPMSTAAMNAVDRTKAGVASGVLSMSRMVGGTFGVAVMGALVAAIGRSKIDQALPNLPAATKSAIASALGSGAPPPAHANPAIAGVVREAFVSALGTGLTIGAAVTVVGAAIAATLIRRSQPRAAAQPQDAAQPAGNAMPAPGVAAGPAGAVAQAADGAEPATGAAPELTAA
jgi:EmrB/QacA subfamily drug resistance transporter